MCNTKRINWDEKRKGKNVEWIKNKKSIFFLDRIFRNARRRRRCSLLLLSFAFKLTTVDSVKCKKVAPIVLGNSWKTAFIIKSQHLTNWHHNCVSTFYITFKDAAEKFKSFYLKKHLKGSSSILQCPSNKFHEQSLCKHWFLIIRAEKNSHDRIEVQEKSVIVIFIFEDTSLQSN